MQLVFVEKFFDRARLARAADGFAIAFAVALPWSTSLSIVLVTVWLLTILLTLDWPNLRDTLAHPAGGIPVALLVLGIIAMAWGDASLTDQLGSVKAYVRPLAIPLLLIQFRRSERGLWVLGGFLASCTVLLALSWYLRFFPWRGTPGDQWSAVPVRDRIIQSGEFLLCAFALTHLSISAWRAEKRGRSAAFMLLALAFLGSIVFVATSRSTLVMFLALLPLLAFQRFDWKGVVVVLMTGAVLASAAWVSSPALRGRVLAVAEEIRKYVTEGEETSAGYRLEFWKKSIEFIATAPVFGHGSGTVEDLFRKSAASEGGRTSSVTDQPHNQTFIVAIQLGLIGTVLLFAFWMAHMMLFRGGGLAAWLGAGIVLQNVIAGLFNSYLFEFTFGWIYIFGVGVLGGMMLRKSGPKTPGLR